MNSSILLEVIPELIAICIAIITICYGIYRYTKKTKTKSDDKVGLKFKKVGDFFIVILKILKSIVNKKFIMNKLLKNFFNNNNKK